MGYEPRAGQARVFLIFHPAKRIEKLPMHAASETEGDASISRHSNKPKNARTLYNILIHTSIYGSTRRSCRNTGAAEEAEWRSRYRGKIRTDKGREGDERRAREEPLKGGTNRANRENEFVI